NGPFNPRKLAFDYDPQLEGKQLNYFVKNLEDFRNCDVLVAGGGDTAVDWALEIDKVAHHTSLLHRRNQFRALESSVKRLMDTKVELLTPNIITGLQLLPDSNKVSVSFKTVGTEDTAQVIVDKILVNYGMTTDSRLLRKWGLELQGPFIPVNSKMQTNLEHVYAAGDVVTYPGKQKLITLGFAEGPIAVS
ncbi:NAD(P)/FAD-dependent oxidoreductase, partial [Lactobacillus sp. XV13L]|nr:NAD(P)/FAD-dependent oxidoreductase [Lactobacillus sp. XV13L]